LPNWRMRFLPSFCLSRSLRLRVDLERVCKRRTLVWGVPARYLVNLSQLRTAMPTYNVLEAKTNLSRLIEAVESGAEPEIIIARNGKPAARIVPLAPARKPVRLGLLAGMFEVPESINRDDAIIERLFDGEAD